MRVGTNLIVCCRCTTRSGSPRTRRRCRCCPAAASTSASGRATGTASSRRSGASSATARACSRRASRSSAGRGPASADRASGQALLLPRCCRARRCRSRTRSCWSAAMADAGDRAGARIADGFLATQNAHHAPYLDACERLRKDPGRGQDLRRSVGGDRRGPGGGWARIGEHALYQLNEYISWGAFGRLTVPQFTDPDQIVEAGAFTADGTPATAVDGADRAAPRHAPDQGRALLGAAARRAGRQRVRAHRLPRGQGRPRGRGRP